MEKLNLTPEEIFKTEFQTDLRGYSPDQVDNMLDLVLEDYQKMEQNTQELLNRISDLEEKIKELKEQNIELESKQKVFDLSSTTSYSSVDLLKRISRLESVVYKK